MPKGKGYKGFQKQFVRTLTGNKKIKKKADVSLGDMGRAAKNIMGGSAVKLAGELRTKKGRKDVGKVLAGYSEKLGSPFAKAGKAVRKRIVRRKKK